MNKSMEERKASLENVVAKLQSFGLPFYVYHLEQVRLSVYQTAAREARQATVHKTRRTDRGAVPKRSSAPVYVTPSVRVSQ